MTSDDYDFVVVGGGTAAVYGRPASQNPATRVLLLEAGGDEVPGNSLDYVGMWDSPVDWAFRTTPQAGLERRRRSGTARPGAGRQQCHPHGPSVRAHRSSYDAWERAGATGWNYDTLLPFLAKRAGPGNGPRWRGTDGPMVVAPGPAAQPGSFYHACYQAAEQAGALATADGNGEQAEGVARTELNIVNFTRQSAADAYLGPSRRRPNLTVVTGASARRLLIDAGRCTGVEYAVGGAARARPRQPRGGTHGGRDRIAAVAASVRYRSRRAAAETRHRGGARHWRGWGRTSRTIPSPASPSPRRSLSTTAACRTRPRGPAQRPHSRIRTCSWCSCTSRCRTASPAPPSSRGAVRPGGRSGPMATR